MGFIASTSALRPAAAALAAPPLRPIVLGPPNELHSGTHGSLVADPPRGVHYRRAPARHTFLLPREFPRGSRFSPHRQPQIGEFLSFDGRDEIVHASRFPVLGRRRWIVDLDHMAYSFLLGRATWNPDLRRSLARCDELTACVTRRIVNQLYGFLHPSCRAVLFWTRFELTAAVRFLEQWGFGGAVEAFLGRAQVVYPAQVPRPRQSVRAKWQALETGAPFTVLFCGRDFEVKNGELALRVFDTLRRRCPGVRLVYIGAIPAARRAALAPLLAQVEVYPEPPRERVLELMDAAHVLFHPSRAESFGHVHLEAFASGAAVVAALGPELRHMPEILRPEGSFLVDYDAVAPEAREDAFVQRLEALVCSPLRARHMGEFNYSLTAEREGRFSVRDRNRRLAEAYAAGPLTAPPLCLEELPYRSEGDAVSLSSDQVGRDLLAFHREIGFEGSNLVA